MIYIEASNHPLISDFQSLKDKEQLAHGQAIVDGERVVIRLLHSSFPLIKMLITQEFYQTHKTVIDKKISNPNNILIAKKNLMEKIVGFGLHQGVMATTIRPANIELNALIAPFMVLSNLTSAENVGAIIRSCYALGVQSIIVDQLSCSPHCRRSIRVSMGHIFSLNVHYTSNLPLTLQKLKSNDTKLIGMAPTLSAININDLKFINDCALIVGNEGDGLSENILGICDCVVKIPMHNQVSSLNAACAATVFLYQLTAGQLA